MSVFKYVNNGGIEYGVQLYPATSAPPLIDPDIVIPFRVNGVTEYMFMFNPTNIATLDPSKRCPIYCYYNGVTYQAGVGVIYHQEDLTLNGSSFTLPVGTVAGGTYAPVVYYRLLGGQAGGQSGGGSGGNGGSAEVTSGGSGGGTTVIPGSAGGGGAGGLQGPASVDYSETPVDGIYTSRVGTYTNLPLVAGDTISLVLGVGGTFAPSGSHGLDGAPLSGANGGVGGIGLTGGNGSPTIMTINKSSGGSDSISSSGGTWGTLTNDGGGLGVQSEFAGSGGNGGGAAGNHASGVTPGTNSYSIARLAGRGGDGGNPSTAGTDGTALVRIIYYT